MNPSTTAAEPELLSRHQDGVLWLAINREARRNAISPGVITGLTEALARANGDRSLRAIVLTAQEALRLGLINRVSDDLDAGVQALLERFLEKSPAAIRRGVYLMKRIGTMSFEASMAFTESQIGLFALTEDAAEGQAAFREKRAPKWSGR